MRHTDYWGEHTLVQAIEHEVNHDGMVLPGRRDIFVVSSPATPPPDLSSITAPDLQVHDLVHVFVDLRGRNRSLTYAAKYFQSVLRYNAPPGSTLVSIELDRTFIDDVVAGVQRDLCRNVTYAGFRNRP
jgi:hypothetical protein